MKHFRFSEDTLKRCTVIQLDERIAKQFKPISPEYFAFFLEANAPPLFSIYFKIEDQIVEFIKPKEFSRELLEKMLLARDRAINESEICLKKRDLPAFLSFISQQRSKKLAKLKSSNLNLNEKVIDAYDTLSSASQLIVKGGLDQDVCQQVEKSAAQLIKSQLDSDACLDTMSNIILCDPTLYDHSASVGMFAALIGQKYLQKYGVSVNLEHVIAGGLYHDIGKSCVPNSLLNKPGKFTPEEYEQMKKHTILGYEELLKAIDSGINIDKDVAIVALEHHERFNGEGYPHKKKGRYEELGKGGIHLYARIVSIADVYSALLMKRVYKEAFDPSEALQIMRTSAAADYDPKLFEIFETSLVFVTNKEEKDKDKGKIIRVG